MHAKAVTTSLEAGYEFRVVASETAALRVGQRYRSTLAFERALAHSLKRCPDQRGARVFWCLQTSDGRIVYNGMYRLGEDGWRPNICANLTRYCQAILQTARDRDAVVVARAKVMQCVSHRLLAERENARRDIERANHALDAATALLGTTIEDASPLRFARFHAATGAA